jgi:hypothetical protein
VINIDKDHNNEASKLQELTAVVDGIFERYSEKDLAKNKNDKHFPFPLKEDGERNVVDQLTYENKIIIEIKSDPILFRTINDLLWNRFFKNKSSKTYDNFLSFNGWIGEKVFNTTNLLACKVNAIKDKKRKRKEEEEKQQQQQKIRKNGENKRDTSLAGRGVGHGEGGRGAGRGGGTLPLTPAAASTTTATAKMVPPSNWSQLSEETKRNAAAVGFSQASFEHMEEEKKSSFPSLIQRLSSEQQQQQQQHHRKGFVGSLKYLKSTKAGSMVIQDGVRYFTIV